MKSSGIVAAGDISNSPLTFSIKATSKLWYHTFVEVFRFDPDFSQQTFKQAVALKNQAIEMNLQASISPHASYSTSFKLIHKLADDCENERLPFTIHNQESKEENLLFRLKTGDLYNQLADFGIDFSTWNPLRKNGIRELAPILPKNASSLLVHNTFSTKKDIEFVNTSDKSIIWVLAPNANLFVTKKLPDLTSLRQQNHSIAIGTDSYASNETISILEELKTLQAHFPECSTEELIQWGTLNGAKALHMEQELGSFDPGKKPGINRLTPLHYSGGPILTSDTIVTPIG
jgi:cytosine/adenosine deaminase-related metal-dependent hydrolase